MSDSISTLDHFSEIFATENVGEAITSERNGLLRHVVLPIRYGGLRTP